MPCETSLTVEVLYTNIPDTKLLKGVALVVELKDNLGNNKPLFVDSISSTELGFIEAGLFPTFT